MRVRPLFPARFVSSVCPIRRIILRFLLYKPIPEYFLRCVEEFHFLSPLPLMTVLSFMFSLYLPLSRCFFLALTMLFVTMCCSSIIALSRLFVDSAFGVLYHTNHPYIPFHPCSSTVRTKHFPSWLPISSHTRYLFRFGIQLAVYPFSEHPIPPFWLPNLALSSPCF